jgi:hypothetical protein
LQGEVHEHNPSRHEERRGGPNGGMDGWVADKTTGCLEEGTTRAAGSVVEAEEVAPDLDHLPRGLPAQVQVSRAHDMRVQVSVEQVVARNALGHSWCTLAPGLPALELVNPGSASEYQPEGLLANALMKEMRYDPQQLLPSLCLAAIRSFENPSSPQKVDNFE